MFRIRRFTIRQLLVVVAVAALASWGLERIVAQRDFLARAGPSQKLFRPIIDHHEYFIHSHATCYPSNAQTGRGHLSRVIGHLGEAVRVLWIDRCGFRIAPIRFKPDIPWRNSLMAARGEWLGATHSCQISTKQRLLLPYHILMRDYYQNLLAKHCVELPPLPENIQAVRQALDEELRRIGGVPFGQIDPEPLDCFRPGWKPPPGPVAPWIGDSF